MNKILLLALSLVSLVLKAQTIPGSETIIFSQQYSATTVVDGLTIGEDKGLNNSTVRFDNAKNKNKSVPEFGGGSINLLYGNTITVTGNKYNITKVVIEFNSTRNVIVEECLSLSSGDYVSSGGTGTWTGNDRSVIFFLNRDLVNRAQICIKSMTVYYGVEKLDSNISFGQQTSFSIFENERFDMPLLEKPDDYSGNISFTSSDKYVADIDENGNIVIITPGKTTITAIGQSTDVYNGSRCSFCLDVKRIVPAGNVFYESFDNYNGEGGNDGFWNGMLYNGIGAFEPENPGWTFTDNDTRYGYKCAIIGRSASSGKAGSVTTPSISLGANKTYILKFRAAAWNASSDKTTLTIAPKSLLSPNTVTMKKGEFTGYSILLTNSTTAVANQKIQFTGEKDSRFFIDDVYVIDPYVTVSSARYTVYVTPMDIDFTMTPGVTAYKAVSASSSGIKLIRVTSAPAKTPIVIEADAGVYKLEEATGLVENLEENMLLPANGEICGDGKTIYGLSNKAGNVGFYKVKEGVKIPLGKAYIVLTDADIQAKEYMPFTGDTTDVHSIWTRTESDSHYYDIQGRKVSCIGKGLYLHNGKKIIF